MKKIAIVTRKIIAGGIETSLINMLEQMNSNEYDITLYVINKGGEFEKFIPSWVKIKSIYGENKNVKERIFKFIKKGQLIECIRFVYYIFKCNTSNSYFLQNFYLLKTAPKDNNIYDLSISYHIPNSVAVVYNAEFLRARKKVGWIHCDVEKFYKENQLNLFKKYYDKFDKIICVSKDAMKKFNNLFPDLSNNTEVFYNITNEEKIKEKSMIEKSYEDGFKGVRILTVARVTEEKGYQFIPSIVKRLIDNGYNIKWYCIGDGDLKEDLYKDIVNKNIENNIELMGTISNPYPYFKDCDIYVQPSQHEGYCITLSEAKVFNKPIVSTNFSGAREQLANRESGLIVEYDENEIYNAIIELIENESLREKLKNNLSQSVVNLNQIDEIINCILVE